MLWMLLMYEKVMTWLLYSQNEIDLTVRPVQNQNEFDKNKQPIRAKWPIFIFILSQP